MNKLIYLLAITTLVLLTGCDSSTDSDSDSIFNLPGAFITNEGNFGQNNGSLCYYSFDDTTVQKNVFEEVNGRLLGDVVQSMTTVGHTGFIVVNNSNTVEVVDIRTMESVATINFTNGESPRNLVVADNGKAYVTGLYSGAVAVVNLDNYSIEKSIAVGFNPDALLLYDDKLYVANSGFGADNTISVIDINSEQVVRTLAVGDYPADMDIDADDEIHVLCSGYSDWQDPSNDTNGGIYVIDPLTDTVIDSLIIEGHPSKLALDGDGKGYFLDGYFGNVSRYSTVTNQLEQAVFIAGSFYGIAVEKAMGRLFVLDPKFFTQDGELQIYNFQGNLLESHGVGMGPGSVTFIYE
jgi:YVTN family beta-propeller protein